MIGPMKYWLTLIVLGLVLISCSHKDTWDDVFYALTSDDVHPSKIGK